jgi:hypothetical protein
VVGKWPELILKYVALLSFIFTVSVYFRDQQISGKRSALDKAQDYIKEYNSDKMQASIQYLSDFWLTNIPVDIRKMAALSPSDGQRIFDNLIHNSPQYTKYEKSLNNILVHMDLVSFCAEQSLCDATIIQAFYCNEYKSLFPIAHFSLQYYAKEGIDLGVRAGRYFDENCHN